MSSHSYLGRFYIVSLIVGLIISIEIDGYRQKRVPQSQNSQDVIPHSMSWLAIVLIKEPTHLWSCSGSLISRPPHHHESRVNGSSDIIITAAHCLRSGGHTVRPQRLSVLLGKHNASGPEESEERFGVINVVIHPKYRQMSYNQTYDIGMLKLETPVKFNKFIWPIPLSNVISNDVASCSLAGWSEGDNGLDAGYWGPNTVLRKLNFLTGKIKYDGALYYNESEAHGVSQGDSGTAVICQAGNQTVIQGVLHKSNFDFVTELFRVYFADIYVLMSWIDDTFKHIDTLRMYHEKLDYYRWISSNVKKSDEDLKQTIEDSTGYQVPTKFDTILMFPQRNRSEFINLWFTLNISEEIYTQGERFGVQGTFGFSTENSVYDCTVICYLENKHGSCSYVAELNRCYFSDAISYENKFLLKITHVVNIRIGEVKDRDLSDAKLFMGNKVPTLNIIGQNDDFGPMMWDVSVTTKGSARHHCEGLLRSTNGVNYDDLDLSGECLQYFKFEESIVVADYKIHQLNKIHTQYAYIQHSKSNEVGITVAYLHRNIEFNDFVQPIALPVGRGNISMADLSLAIVAIVDGYVLNKNELIYQIPIKIHSYETIDGVEMATTERLYKAADTPDHLSVELGQGVLVGFEKSIRQHFVIGLNATTVQKSGHQHIERHILIEPQTEWIRRAISDTGKIYNEMSD